MTVILTVAPQGHVSPESPLYIYQPASIHGTVSSFTITQTEHDSNDAPLVFTRIYTGNFTYDGNGALAGGIFTGASQTLNGALQWQLSETSVPVSAYLAQGLQPEGTIFDSYFVSDLLAFSVGPVSITGGAFIERLNGSPGNDTIFGGSDIDSLSGNSGNDFINGNRDTDYLAGNDGNDTIHGGKGSDYLGDVLFINGGEQGNDLLFGDLGDDTLRGAQGNDTLVGGQGADDFDFRAGYGSTGNDVITDFTPGVDRITITDSNGHKLLYAVGRDAAGDTVVIFSGADTVTLVGVAPEALHAGDINP